MSIQIIDNFYLNSAKPIDNRFVVGSQSFYTHRDFIDWKYVGMRVWDLNDGVNGMPYVWTGTTYSSENSISIGGSGTVNKIPKFVTTTTVGDSNIYDDGTYVGISNPAPAYKLDVIGSIKASANLYGAASDLITGAQTITNINADAITGGTLLLNRLQNSSNNNWILTSGNPAGSGQSTWTNPTTITVGNATTAVNSTNAAYASQINIISLATNTTAYLLFSTTTGNSTVYSNTSNTIKINPSNGRVTIGNSTSFSAGLRVTAPMGSGFDTINAGFATGWNNFRVLAASSGTTLRLEGYPTGTSASTYWTKYGGANDYDEIGFSGRAYMHVNGSGTSNSRLITFGGSGIPDQVRFYMIGNSSTVPTVGGYGVYIDRNLQVAGTFSAGQIGGNVAMISSEPNINCTKTITSNADRWVTDFTTGANAGVSATNTALASVNYDRIVYVIHYSSGQGGAQIQVETTSGFEPLGRMYNLGYASTSAIIPAGKQFKIFLEHNSGTTIYDIIIYKFGRT